MIRIVLLLAHIAGWVLIIHGAATGLINGPFIIGAALILGSAATINYLNTEKES